MSRLSIATGIAPAAELAGLARRAEDAGFDALWTSEMFHDPFLPLAAGRVRKANAPHPRVREADPADHRARAYRSADSLLGPLLRGGHPGLAAPARADTRQNTDLPGGCARGNDPDRGGGSRWAAGPPDLLPSLD